MTIKHLKHLQSHKYCSSEGNCELSNGPNLDHEEKIKQFRLGYQECLSEAVRFLVEIEGLYTGDGLCRRIMDHLQDLITSFTKNCMILIQFIHHLIIYNLLFSSRIKIT